MGNTTLDKLQDWMLQEDDLQKDLHVRWSYCNT
jgi:hypothetical protein